MCWNLKDVKILRNVYIFDSVLPQCSIYTCPVCHNTECFTYEPASRCRVHKIPLSLGQLQMCRLNHVMINIHTGSI